MSSTMETQSFASQQQKENNEKKKNSIINCPSVCRIVFNLYTEYLPFRKCLSIVCMSGYIDVNETRSLLDFGHAWRVHEFLKRWIYTSPPACAELEWENKNVINKNVIDNVIQSRWARAHVQQSTFRVYAMWEVNGWVSMRVWRIECLLKPKCQRTVLVNDRFRDEK